MIARNTFTRLLLISLCVCIIGATSPTSPPPEEYTPESTSTDLYQGEDGGYIACYCHCADTGLYTVGDGIYYIGQIRMQGYYDDNGIFQPKGYEGQDISAIDCFKFVCNMAFTGCCGGCWAGGDTGTPKPPVNPECPYGSPGLCNHDTHLP